MCHAREPVYEGIHWAPKGVVLETDADIVRAAREIYLQSGVTNAMPPANVSYMEEDERRKIVDWYRAAREKAPFGSRFDSLSETGSPAGSPPQDVPSRRSVFAASLAFSPA